MIITNALGPYSGTEINVLGELIGNSGRIVGGGVYIELTSGGVTPHKHIVHLTADKFRNLMDGTSSSIIIASSSGLESGSPHTHAVSIEYDGEKLVITSIGSNHANAHGSQVSLGIPAQQEPPQEQLLTPSVKIIDHNFDMVAGSGNNTASVIHTETINLGVLDNKEYALVRFYDPGTVLDPGPLTAGSYNVYPPLNDIAMVGVPDKDMGSIAGSGYSTLPTSSAHTRNIPLVPFSQALLYKGLTHGNTGMFPTFLVTESQNQCTRSNIVQDASYRAIASSTSDILKEVTIESMAPLSQLRYSEEHAYAPGDTTTLTGPIINVKDWTGSNPVAAGGVITATDPEYGPWWPLGLDQACLQTMYLQQNGSDTELVVKFIVIKATPSLGVNLKLAVFH